MNKKYDVFISYSRKDSAYAEELCNEFDKFGITYFIDKTGIYSGQEFMQILAENILNCELVVFLGSANSYKSDYTAMEVAFAIKRKIRLIPYLIDDSNLPLNLELAFSTLNKRRRSNFPVASLVAEISTRLRKAREEDVKNDSDTTVSNTKIISSIPESPEFGKYSVRNFINHCRQRHLVSNLFLLAQVFLLLIFLVCSLGVVVGGCIAADDTISLSRYLMILVACCLVISLVSTFKIMLDERAYLYSLLISNMIGVIAFCRASEVLFDKYAHHKFYTLVYESIQGFGFFVHSNGLVVSIAIMIGVCLFHFILLYFILKIGLNKENLEFINKSKIYKNYGK